MDSKTEELLIYSFHIVIGLFFVYSGYELISKKQLNDKLILLIIILGALAIAYHSHLLLLSLLKSLKK